MKTCIECREEKSELDFYFRKRQGKLRNECKQCHSRNVFKSAQKNPDVRMRRHYRRYYNITLEDVLALRERQAGRCAICRREKKLVVDHDHATGRVRGLLCNGCNRALGYVEDNVETLKSAIEYLREVG